MSGMAAGFGEPREKDETSQYRASPLPFEHILILDDDLNMAESLGELLRSRGLKVDYCSKTREARELIKTADEGENETTAQQGAKEELSGHFDAAIIDINLTHDETSINRECGGIYFAKEVQETHPQCKIILVSGEEIKRDEAIRKAEVARRLFVAGYIEKPFAGDDFFECLNRAKSIPPEDGYDLFKHLAPHEPANNDMNAHSVETSFGVQGMSDVVAEIKQLQVTTKAVTVCLFSVHPVSLSARIEVLAGEGPKHPEWEHKLRFSPVRDVAIDGEIIDIADVGPQKK